MPFVYLQNVWSTGKGDEVVELAKIEKVELRDAWSHEAADFTPWLQDNMDQLGAALGMDLEAEESEAAVGTFSLDLLAHDGNSRLVIIENQLEPTDHSHLGQLLTYAAGYDAGAIVWIAKEFRDEHRAALDFLNSRTGEDTEFFGVVVEAWRIDNSRPAPNFNVVVTPNGWHKRNSSEKTRQRRESKRRGENNLQFRLQLEERLRRDHSFSVSEEQGISNASWCVLEDLQGIANHYSTDFRKESVCVNLVVGARGVRDLEGNHRILTQLERHKTAIETQLLKSSNGEWSEWNQRGDTRCFVSIYRKGSIHSQQESWDELHEWIIEKFFNFRRVLKPYLDDAEQRNGMREARHAADK